MKYKVGQKVRIKKNQKYPQGIRMILSYNDYVLTITHIEKEIRPDSHYYHFKEFEEQFFFNDDDIEGIYCCKNAAVTDRFDLLDL